MTKISRSIGLLLFLITALFYHNLPVYAESETQTVKVGYYTFANYQEISETGEYCGYGYDYLQEIAKYTNWQYEYVPATLEECVTMLAQGEIDLVGGLTYTEERAKTFAYPKYSQGTSSISLYVKGDNRTLAYGDVQAFDGLTVGLVQGYSIIEDLDDYCRENAIKMNKVLFQTREELSQALAAGQVDAILTSNFTRGDEVRCIADIAFVDFYIVTTPENKDILATLNQAMAQIKSFDPYFEKDLKNKYTPQDGAGTPVFTREEQAFIKENPTLRVAYNSDWTPIEYTDEATGEPRGVNIDILKKISQATGISFQFLPVDSVQAEFTMVQAGKADLISAAVADYSWANAKDIKLSNSYIPVPTTIVRNPHAKKGDKLAMPRYAYLTEEVAPYHTSQEILYCDSFNECFEAVRRGKASATIIDSYRGEYLLNQAKYTDLQSFPLGNSSQELAIAFAHDCDVRLITIIDKTIGYISQDQITDIIIANSTYAHKNTLLDLLYRYPLTSILSVTIIMATIIILLTIILFNKSRYAKEINHLLYIDDLTGIWSLNKFRQAGEKILRERGTVNHALIYINIKDFKFINDTYGYGVGDTTLKKLAQILSASLQGDEALARIHSDHFVAMLEYEQSGELYRRLDNLKERIADLSSDPQIGCDVLTAIGVYPLSPGETDINAAIDKANYAREQLPKGSRGKYIFYDDNLVNKLQFEKKLEREMAQALTDGDFKTYYQPKVDCFTGQVIGAEALVRWEHRELGIIPPSDFIPLFERNGFITKLDLYVFTAMCQQMAQWRDRGLPIFPISSNFSRLHLTDRSFANRLEEIANQHGIEHKLLEIEITENVALDELDYTKGQIKKLRAKGFNVAIDDFGSGYSSLGILSDFPFDIIKLDKSFMKAREFTKEERATIQGIVQIAHALDKKIVCEGVETKAQVEFLRSVNCHYVQGYYYAKPLPVQQFTEYAWDK